MSYPQGPTGGPGYPPSQQPNAQIAAQLSLSVSAVKMYVHALMAKFEAQSRLETIARARAAGFQPSEGH